MYTPHFSLFGSPHQRVYRESPGNSGEAGGNVVPFPAQNNNASAAPVSAVDSNGKIIPFSPAPTGKFSTLSWPTRSSWRILGRTAQELIGAAPKAIGATINATRWGIGKIFGFGGKVATRGANFIKGGVWDATTGRVVDVAESAAVNSVNLAYNAAIKPIFGAINVTRGALLGTLGILKPAKYIPGLKWLGKMGDSATKTAAETIKEGSDQLLQPFQLNTYRKPLYGTLQATKENLIAAPAYLANAHAQVVSPDFGKSILKGAGEMSLRGDESTAAMFETPDNVVQFNAKRSRKRVSKLLGEELAA